MARIVVQLRVKTQVRLSRSTEPSMGGGTAMRIAMGSCE